MKYVLWAAGLALLLSINACGVSQYTASTTAAVGGANGFSYTSNKNQEALDATGEMDPGGIIKFSVKTTASTPEAAIAAAMQTNLEIQKQLSAILQTLLPLIEAAAKAAAASKGVPLP